MELDSEDIEWWELSEKLDSLLRLSDEGLERKAEVVRDSIQEWSRDYYRSEL